MLFFFNVHCELLKTISLQSPCTTETDSAISVRKFEYAYVHLLLDCRETVLRMS